MLYSSTCSSFQGVLEEHLFIVLFSFRIIVKTTMGFHWGWGSHRVSSYHVMYDRSRGVIAG